MPSMFPEELSDLYDTIVTGHKQYERDLTVSEVRELFKVHNPTITRAKHQVISDMLTDIHKIPAIGKDVAKDVLQKISHKLDESYVYSSEINLKEEFYGFGTMDAAAYGTSSTMDIFSSLYKHTFMSDDFNMIPMGHSIIPFYMKYIGLNMGKSQISQNLINKIRKPEQFKKLTGDTTV